MTLILTMMFGLAAGYIAAVITYLLITMGITAAAPHFVTVRGRFRPTYLLVSCALWLLCAALGGYLSTWLSAAWFPWFPVMVLAVSLAAVAWLYPMETRKQLAGAPRYLMTVASLAGVGLGYYLKMKH